MVSSILPKNERNALRMLKYFRVEIPTYQSMTWDLFWLAALANPQPKSRPQLQLHATCFFDGRNSFPQLYSIEVPNLEF